MSSPDTSAYRLQARAGDRVLRILDEDQRPHHRTVVVSEFAITNALIEIDAP